MHMPHSDCPYSRTLADADVLSVTQWSKKKVHPNADIGWHKSVMCWMAIKRMTMKRQLPRLAERLTGPIMCCFSLVKATSVWWKCKQPDGGKKRRHPRCSRLTQVLPQQRDSCTSIKCPLFCTLAILRSQVWGHAPRCGLWMNA